MIEMPISESPALFIFAHQDDECGCFSELNRLVDRGDEVFVVYLTSGTPDGRPSQLRNLESVGTLARIGIARNNIHFLGEQIAIPDGQLSCNLEKVYESVLEMSSTIGLPKRLYFPSWEGGHQDHDAAHLIGLALGKRLKIIDNCFQFSLYTGHNLPSVFFKVLTPLPDNGAQIVFRISWRKRFQFLSYCLCYPSQKLSWLGLFPFFFIHYLFSGTQIFQPVSLSRIIEQPHPGKLLYERRGVYSYQEFVESAKCFIEKNLRTKAEIDP